MTREQLEHGIRAACSILGTQEVYIVGSQSILASYPNLSGPISKSKEMDALPILPQDIADNYEAQQRAADTLNANAGEGTPFLSTHGFEIEGVVESDLVMPSGWRRRTIPLSNENTNLCTGHCLDPYDMAAAKVAAGRRKDRMTVTNLIRQQVIKPAKLIERIQMISKESIFDNSTIDDLIARAKRWIDLTNPNENGKSHGIN